MEGLIFSDCKKYKEGIFFCLSLGVFILTIRRQNKREDIRDFRWITIERYTKCINIHPYFYLRITYKKKSK